LIHIQHKLKPAHQTRSGKAGFTMVEVVIAGAILVSTMTAVAQMSISALAGSKNLSTRSKIESAINNDIQLLQKKDSYLTFDSIRNLEDEAIACEDPTDYLITHLTKNDSNQTIELSKLGITRSMKVGMYTLQIGAQDHIKKRDWVEVSYQFTAPETGIDDEYRVIELNPNFSAQCYTTQ
jgi:type II secretory pathway pseudopilin PulG